MAVLIPHRFSTVRMADHIYVIEDGRVSEHGSHDELIRARAITPRGSTCRRRPIAETPLQHDVRHNCCSASHPDGVGL